MEDEAFDNMRFARMRTELDPDDPEGHLELGWYLLQHGRLEGADSAFARVLEIEPGDANARYFRAQIAASWGHPERAAREFARLLKRFPDIDLAWPCLRDSVDYLLRRTHLWVTLPLAVAAVSALGNDLVTVVAIVMLMVAATIAGARYLLAARRLGGPLLRSLVRMRVRQSAGIRLSLIADGVAVLLVVAIAIVPSGWSRPLGLATLLVLAVAALAHVFRARDPDAPDGA